MPGPVARAVSDPPKKPIPMYALTGSADNTARIWDLSGNELQRFEHSEMIEAVAYSPDGTAQLWDVETGALIKTFGSGVPTTWDVAFSPNGQQLTMTSGNKIELFSVPTYSGNAVSTIAFSIPSLIPQEVVQEVKKIAKQLSAQKLMYNVEELTDNSGIYHRIIGLLEKQFPEYAYPNSRDHRSIRNIAEWYYNQGELTVISDPLAQGVLIQPGALLFYGSHGIRAKKSGGDASFQIKGINHVGVVVAVEKDDNGLVTNYSIFHGQRAGKVAGITSYHPRKPKRTTYPSYGNNLMDWLVVAPIVGSTSVGSKEPNTYDEALEQQYQIIDDLKAKIADAYQSATFIRSASKCPDDVFFDPIDGGTCWQCPPGYKRTVYAVNANRACEKQSSVEYARAIDRGKGTGVLGTDCPKGSFYDPNGKCYSCPDGYTRTVYAVTGSQACSRQSPAVFASARKISELGCSGNQFLDPRNGGECWECPDGYVRTIQAIEGQKACVSSQLAQWEAKLKEEEAKLRDMEAE